MKFGRIVSTNNVQRCLGSLTISRATTGLGEREDLQKEVTSERNQISNQATSLQAYYQESTVLHLQIAEMKECSAADHAVFAHLI